jgi:radical SAM superfamily enzyme YgiQ (UPF0313 family)
MHPSKKNLILINPWIYDFAAYDLWSQPLGLLYLASFLRYNGFNISYLDCLRAAESNAETKPGKYGIGKYQREVVSKPEILKDIPRKYARYGITEQEFLRRLAAVPQPDAILITSIMTYWYPGPQHVVELAKRMYPDVPIILGGIYATLLPQHARTVIQPDYIIQGPGEWQVLKILADILDLDLATEPSFKNLDDYPYPALDLIPHLRYQCIITARGCPFDCSFCAQKQISMQFKQRKPDQVLKEMTSHYNKFKKRDFAFYDDALFVRKEKHIKVILNKIIESRFPFRLHTPNGLFAKEIDEELAVLMYKSNFKTIRLSFETVNENRQKDMFDKISNQGMKEAVRNLVFAGYRAKEIEAYIIMGLPEQTLEEIIESIIFINNLGVKVKLASFSPIPGTLDFKRAVQSGKISKDIDPLLTNNTIFPLRNAKMNYDVFRKVRIFSQILNEAAQKEYTPFSNDQLGNSLRKVIRDLY